MNSSRIGSNVGRTFNAKLVPTNRLSFDARNPRLSDIAISETNQKRIKGNRRLAAVKLLTSKELQNDVGVSGVPEIDPQLRRELSKLPIIETTREQVWDRLAFRNIVGPQTWDSIGKAQYIERLHESYDISLEMIAKAIGDRNATVRRLYHGLKVLHQAQYAGVFDPKNRFYQRKDFAYSHLWASLGYEGIQEFLGLKNGDRDERKPIARKNISALGELCLWLYGSHSNSIEPLVKSQNPHLRQLDEALRSPRGIAALRSHLSLQSALNAARGDARLLLDSLIAAEKNLREAKGYLSTGYSGQQDVIDTINNIRSLAISLDEELATTETKKKKR